MPELEAIQAAISKAGHTWTAIDPPQGRPYSLGWEPSPQPLIDRSTVMADQLKVLRLPALLPHVAGDLAAAMPLGAPPHPLEFDGRTRGVVGAVTDQENCGSCVSFATAGLVSTKAGIELGTRDLDLSEADQHFNSAHGASCGGWNNASSLAEVQVRGISLEFDFAYDSAFDNPTQFGGDGLNIAHSRPEPLRNVNAYKVSGVQSWTGDDRKYYLSTVGPLICGFQVFEDFDHYGGGVYRHVSGDIRGGHAVLVVGYSDTDRSWICRKSWGDWFGGPGRPDGTGAGYFKLGYGECNIDNEPMFGCTGVIPPKATVHVGLAEFNGRLYAGWKGIHSDERLFLGSTPATAWDGGGQTDGMWSSVGPSFAVFGDRLFSAWKGMNGDQRLWWSCFDGQTWTPQQMIPGVASSVGPAVAVFQNRLYAMWNNDQGLWWSSFDGHAWAPQQVIGGMASSHGPSIAVFQEHLYAA